MKPITYVHLIPGLCCSFVSASFVLISPSTQANPSSHDIHKVISPAEAFSKHASGKTVTSTPVFVSPQKLEAMRKKAPQPMTLQEETLWKNKLPHGDYFHTFAYATGKAHGSFLTTFIEGQNIECQRDFSSLKNRRDTLAMCQLLRDRTVQKLSEVKISWPDDERGTPQKPIGLFPFSSPVNANPVIQEFREGIRLQPQLDLEPTIGEVATGVKDSQTTDLKHFVEAQALICKQDVKDFFPGTDDGSGLVDRLLPLCDLLRDRTIQKISEIQPPSLQEIRAAQPQMKPTLSVK